MSPSGKPESLFGFAMMESKENDELRAERDETREWICRIGIALGVACPPMKDEDTAVRTWQRWREAIEASIGGQ